LVHSVAFSPDGQRLASGGDDKTVKVWDLGQPEGQPLTLRGHTDQVWSVAFSPDRQRLASGSWDETVKVWDLGQPEGQPLTLRGHTGMVYSVAFSPDGQRLASGSDDKTVKVWTLGPPEGQPLTLRGHTGDVFSVAFSPDGQRLFTRDSAGGVLAWDPRTGERLASEKPPAMWSGQSAQSPDGKLLALGQSDGSIDLVELRPPSETEILYRRWKSAFDPVWQEQEAARHEKAGQWFAAAFHLRQLLAHKAGDVARLKGRLKRCEEKLKTPGNQ
jgi:WD40 repeat protein